MAGDIETANKLAWAGAVANETMRLRPVAPIHFLDAKVETVVGDLLVPKGTEFACSAPGGVRSWSLRRSPGLPTPTLA